MRSCHKRKGSSTILIIMIVITLVLFGILSVISAYSSFRLSEKSASYLQMNFELEDAAYQMKAEIVSALRSAEREALAAAEEERERVYRDRLKQALLQIDSSMIRDFQVREEEQGIRVQGLIEKSYPAGVERFSFEMELPYPKRRLTGQGQAEYRTLRWKKLPKEMEYEDVMEFENIEVEAPKEESP